jgi:hypothetical protein
MKLSNKDSDGTSWFMDTFTTSVRYLREKVGDPQCECNTGEDKVNFDWSENEGVLDDLIKFNIISKPISTVPTGFVVAHKCKLLI